MFRLTTLADRLALASWLVLGGLVAPAAAAEIGWLTDVGKALTRAQSEGRPVFVDIWAVWCVPCAQLDRTTYRAPAVIELASRFVPLKVDNDAQTTFVQAHRIDAWPTLLFLDGDGKELTRVEGYVTASELEPTLRHLADGYSGYRTGMAREATPTQRLVAASYLDKAGNGPGAVALLERSIKAEKTAGRREPLELGLARLHLGLGNLKAATRLLERLRQSADPEIRAAAEASQTLH